jgi:hypothetical protein
MSPPKKERLREIFRRLRDLPPASSFDEVLRQLTETMNTVEDELSGVPYNPALWRSDGRMYPPQREMERRAKGKRGVRVFRSVAHRTYISRNGAIEIQLLDGTRVFQKLGADGKGVEA